MFLIILSLILITTTILILDFLQLLNIQEKYVFASKIIFIFIIIMIALMNIENQDTINYSSEYIKAGDGIFPPYELVYSLLMSIFSKLNISYFIFKNLIIVTSCTLLFFTTKLLTKTNTLAILLTSIFPFFLNIIQLRFLLASSIVVFAIAMYFKHNKKSLFYFLIVLSFFIHSSTIVFIIIPFCSKINKKNFIYIVLSLTMLIFILVTSDYINNFLLLFISEEKLYYYLTLTQRLSTFGLITICVLQFVFPFFISFYFCQKDKFSSLVLIVNSISLCLMPLLKISFEFSRFPRVVLLLNYILWGNIIYLETNNNRKIIYFAFVFAQVVLSWFALQRWGILTIFQNSFLF